LEIVNFNFELVGHITFNFLIPSINILRQDWIIALQHFLLEIDVQKRILVSHLIKFKIVVLVLNFANLDYLRFESAVKTVIACVIIGE